MKALRKGLLMKYQQKTIILTCDNERHEYRQNQKGEWHNNGKSVTDQQLIENLNRTSITSSANSITIGDTTFKVSVYYEGAV